MDAARCEWISGIRVIIAGMTKLNVLDNSYLKVTIKEEGAELTSIFGKQQNLEYLWQADPAFWPKQSPVLFPIVGTLRNNEYQLAGKIYNLNRHGFAREQKFIKEKSDPTSITFIFRSNQNTFRVYPYHFEFRILYSLTDSTLSVTYKIRNISDQLMYFSIGAHPAFNVPLEKNKSYESYFLKFEKKEFANRWPITSDGLIANSPEQFFSGDNIVPLTKSLFRKDALVFKDLASNSIILESDKGHGIRMEYPGFPYFGIWAAKNADFICLEPWCGIADQESHSGHFTEKEGINLLNAGETFERTWRVHCY